MQELAGIPLAIELLANRAASWSDLSAIWQDWKAQGTKSATRLNDSGDKLDSLSRSIDFSTNSRRLSVIGRRLLSILGLLPSGIGEADVTPLFGPDAAQAATELLSVGLAFELKDRLDLLPPIRDYAKRHFPTGTSDQQNAISYVLRLTSKIGALVGFQGGAAAIARLAPETGNIEIALTLAVPTVPDELLLTAAFGFTEYARFSGASSPSPLLTLANNFKIAKQNEQSVDCIRLAADIYLDRSNHSTAEELYNKALRIYVDHNSIRGEAQTLYRLGYIELRRRRLEEAEIKLTRAISLFESLADRLGAANCIKRLGDAELERDNFASARDAYQRALPLYEATGSVRGKGIVHKQGRYAKEHNADFMNIEAIRLRRGIIDAFNVAPEFGITQTRLMLRTARELGVNCDEFLEEAYNSLQWERWVTPGVNDRELCAVVAAHYVRNSASGKKLDEIVSKRQSYQDELRHVFFEIFDRYNEEQA